MSHASIRHANATDSVAIADLLETLGYPGTQSFIAARVSQLLAHPDETLLVAIDGERVLGVISLHFVPQLALPGDFCRISYFCVASEAQGRGVGALLEQEAEAIARTRGCDRIELHCDARRADAHRFYLRQGYHDAPKYFCKSVREIAVQATAAQAVAG